jgi:hypothetical protein
MKKDVQKRLKAYSAVAGAALLIPGTAAAEIQYTDVDPDETLTTPGDLFEVDFNGDGTVDMNLALVTGTGTYGGTALYQNFAWAFGYGYGSFAGSTQSFGAIFYFPFAYNSGDMIGSSAQWQNASAVGSMNYLTSVGGAPAYQGGNWVNATDKYLGCRFVVAGNFHYGWIRMDVGTAGPSNFITIKGFAFEDVPDAEIEAGATSGGVVISSIQDIEDLNDKVSIYGFGSNLTVQLEDFANEDARIEVYNMSGQMVLDAPLNDAYAQFTMNVSDGMYAVRVRIGDGLAERKIYLSGSN